MKKLFTRAIALIMLVVLCGCGKPTVSEKVETVDTPDAIVSKTINTSSVKSEVISKDESSKKTTTSSEKTISSEVTSKSVTSSALSSTVSTENDVIVYEYPVVEEIPLATESVVVNEVVKAEDTDTTIEEEEKVESKKSEESQVTLSPEVKPVVVAEYSASDLQFSGVIYWGGWRWTWYSQKVLPGPGLVIPGRHVDENGYVCDGDDNICLAATSLCKGTIVDTPFGKQGKVYDSGCAYGTLDVYVAW